MYFIKNQLSLVIFSLIWAGFGIFGFFLVWQWQVEYEEDISLIDQGQAEEIRLTITQRGQNLGAGEGEFGFYLASEDGEHRKFVELPFDEWEKTRVGDAYQGYWVNERLRVLEFDTGGHRWGKWVFLAVGVIPSFAFLSIVTAGLIRHPERLSLWDVE